MPLQCNIPENSYRLQGKILKLSKIKKKKNVFYNFQRKHVIFKKQNS